MAKGTAQKKFDESGLHFKAWLWAAAEQAVPASPGGTTEFNSARPEGLFLKYISDAFEEKREQLLFGFSNPKSEWFIKDEPQRAEAAENRDFFSLSASNVIPRSRERERMSAGQVRDVGKKQFNAEMAGVRCRFPRLPPEARWHTIKAKAKSPEIGKVINEAMGAIEGQNFPIPTGLHLSAQGCPVSGTTLGKVIQYFPQPQRGCINRSRARGCNPFRVVEFSGRFPRVAPRQSGSDQPRAERHSPVGAKQCRADLHPDLKADFVPVWKGLVTATRASAKTTLAKANRRSVGETELHPPFNMSAWGGENLRQDLRWKFGMPPANNALLFGGESELSLVA